MLIPQRYEINGVQRSVRQHAWVHLTPGMEVVRVKTRAETDSTILSIYNSNLIKVSATSLPLQCGFLPLTAQQMSQLQHQAVQAKQLFLLYQNLNLRQSNWEKDLIKLAI